MASLILLVGFLLNFAAFGNGLQCYTYTCSNQTGVPGLPIANCPSPVVTNCNDREDYCMTKRYKTATFKANLGKYLYTTKESRTCIRFTREKCHIPDYYCKQSNRTGDLVDCDIGCCQGDLCNNGYIPPRAPETKGSLSGSDLSCYSCATEDHIFIGIKGRTNDCNRPVNATCGKDFFRDNVEQDRCMSIKAVVNNHFYKEIVNLRSCSNPYFCNQDFACKKMNKSGDLESCNMSCCFGKYCNGPGPIAKPSVPSGSNLSCYSCATQRLLKIKSPTYDCDRPVNETCGNDRDRDDVQQDRCMSVKAVINNGFYKEVVNLRSCSDPYYCNQDFACSSMNASGELESCNMSCCFGKNCNGPGPIDESTASSKISSIPPAHSELSSMPTAHSELSSMPTAHSELSSIPTAPPGSDLLCYSCTSDKKPKKEWKIVDANCKNPTKQTCSHHDYGKRDRQKHDRCLRISIDFGNDIDQQVTNVEYRNCSSSGALFCNKDIVCNYFNKSGNMKKCDVSCCVGDYCNGNPVATSPPSSSTTHAQVALVSTGALLLIGLTTILLVH